MDKKPKTIVFITRKLSGTEFFSTLSQTSFKVITCTDLKETEPFEIDQIAGVFISNESGTQESARLTRQLRLSWGNRYRPIVWIAEQFSTEDNAEVYSSGADACWTVPLDQADRLAQWDAFSRRAMESDEISSMLIERQELAKTVRSLHDRRQNELKMAHEILDSNSTSPPAEIGPFRITANPNEHRDFTTRIESFPLLTGIRIVVSEISSRSGWAEVMTAYCIRELARNPLAGQNVLKKINRTLLEHQSELLPAAVAVLDLNPQSSEIELSQAGLQLYSTTRDSNAIQMPQFPETQLGIYDVEFHTFQDKLKPGQRISIMKRENLIATTTDGFIPCESVNTESAHSRQILAIECADEDLIHLP